MDSCRLLVGGLANIFRKDGAKENEIGVFVVGFIRIFIVLV